MTSDVVASDGAGYDSESSDNCDHKHSAKGTAGGRDSNVLVVVRMRPFLQREIDAQMEQMVEVIDDHVIVVRQRQYDPVDVLRRRHARERRYAFDHVFPPDAVQRSVFERTTEFLIPGVLDGINSTVFAYGATGSGKTYTMLGTRTSPGLMFHTMEALFNRVASDDLGLRSVTVSVMFIEIYNEYIRDLLAEHAGPSDYLDLREKSASETAVAGVRMVAVTSVEDVMSLLVHGNNRRTTESTAANEASSRSHAVMQLHVTRSDHVGGSSADPEDEPIAEKVVSKLSLIDLAGSERAAATQNRGARMIEGANINRSLLALGNCINALVRNVRAEDAGKDAPRTHIPYRDSKLTRILKDSLGGNCRTVMISCIAPGGEMYEESVNTLKYANRAKNIKTRQTRNVLSTKYHVTAYKRLISELRGEVARLRSDLATIGNERPAPAVMALPAIPTATKQELVSIRQQIAAKDRLLRQRDDTIKELSAALASNNLVHLVPPALRKQLPRSLQTISLSSSPVQQQQSPVTHASARVPALSPHTPSLKPISPGDIAANLMATLASEVSNRVDSASSPRPLSAPRGPVTPATAPEEPELKRPASASPPNSAGSALPMARTLRPLPPVPTNAIARAPFSLKPITNSSMLLQPSTRQAGTSIAVRVNERANPPPRGLSNERSVSHDRNYSPVAVAKRNVIPKGKVLPDRQQTDRLALGPSVPGGNSSPDPRSFNANAIESTVVRLLPHGAGSKRTSQRLRVLRSTSRTSSLAERRALRGRGSRALKGRRVVLGSGYGSCSAPDTGNAQMSSDTGVDTEGAPKLNASSPLKGVSMALKSNDGAMNLQSGDTVEQRGPRAGPAEGDPAEAGQRGPRAGPAEGDPAEAGQRGPRAGPAEGDPAEAGQRGPRAGPAEGDPAEAGQRGPRAGPAEGDPAEAGQRGPLASTTASDHMYSAMDVVIEHPDAGQPGSAGHHEGHDTASFRDSSISDQGLPLTGIEPSSVSPALRRERQSISDAPPSLQGTGSRKTSFVSRSHLSDTSNSRASVDSGLSPPSLQGTRSPTVEPSPGIVHTNVDETYAEVSTKVLSPDELRTTSASPFSHKTVSSLTESSNEPTLKPESGAEYSAEVLPSARYADRSVYDSDFGSTSD